MQSLKQHDQVPVDDLDHILSSLYVDREVGARCGLFSTEDMASGERADASFHFVVSGRCCLSVPRIDMSACLEEGDLLVMLRGDAVVFADTPDRDRQVLRHFRDPARRGYCRILEPGGSEVARLLCGYFRFHGDHPFAAMLPPFILVRASESQDISRLRSTMEFMIEETATPARRRAGSTSPSGRVALHSGFSCLCVATRRLCGLFGRAAGGQAGGTDLESDTRTSRVSMDRRSSRAMTRHAHGLRSWRASQVSSGSRRCAI